MPVALIVLATGCSAIGLTEVVIACPLPEVAVDLSVSPELRGGSRGSVGARDDDLV